jgi:hypothetical protein
MKKRGNVLMTEALLYVLFILALSGIAVSHIDFSAGPAAKAQAETAAIGAAISQYRYEMDQYPDTLNDLTRITDGYGPWISVIHADPWGNSYQYKHDTSRFAIYSYGEDGIDHGSDITTIAAGDIGFFGQ